MHKSLRIFLHWKFVSSSHLLFYLVVYLYKYKLMDICFIPWERSQYYSFTFMCVYMFCISWYCSTFGNWELLLGTDIHFTYPIIVWDFLICLYFVLHFLAFWKYKMLKALVIYFLPSDRIRHFFKEPWSLYWRMVLYWRKL